MLKTKSTVRQLNDLYKRSPDIPGRLLPPQFKLLPPVSALVGAAALVLLTPKPTANEDAILRRLKKEEIERKLILDPPESPEGEPPPFTGGQCPVLYRVNMDIRLTAQAYDGQYDNLQLYTGGLQFERPGAIQDVGIFYKGAEFGYWCYAVINGVRQELQQLGTNPGWLRLNSVNVNRIDGLPDNCGNPPSPTSPTAPKPNTIADPNRIKRERGDRPAPGATPKFIDTRPLPPDAGWKFLPPPGFSWTKPGFKKDPNFNPNNEPFKLAPDSSPVSTPSDLPLPFKKYFPQKQPLEISPQPAPRPNPQERPFPPQSVPDGIAPQSTPQPLAPPSQKTDTAPLPVPTSRPTFSPSTPGLSPTPNRNPIAIPAPNPIPQPVVITGPASDPGKAGSITYSSPQNFVPNPTTLAPQPQTLPTVKAPVEPTPAKSPLEDIREKLEKLIIPVGTLGVGITQILRRTTTEALETAAKNGTCQTTQPGGCTTAAINRGNQDLLAKLGLGGGQAVDLLLLGKIDDKLGNKITGGLSGGLGRMSSFLGIDRVLNLINTMAILHNALMLSNGLKITLLETLSSIGNATGLLQTSENENVNLNETYNKGIQAMIDSVIGEEKRVELDLLFKKYNRIYQAGANVINSVQSMMSSIGNVVETTAEYTGKIGNALKAVGGVAENAYQWMAEQQNARISKFLAYTTTVAGATVILSALGEVAESVIEGQQAKTEADAATNKFKEELATAQKNPGIENKTVADEIKRRKEAATANTEGADDTGLFSNLTL